ncbi:MAG: 4Fe-4S dicluster domain-containing protein [Candidatus Omnitrophota bacterium]|jgi:2-oxoglutarate ferredoxin oxidoreductase subunit delta|nr:MAG: 4Fe-4S dicluster domain-containing protein [Candidatus Omnitrophota bacterium]
MAKIVIDSQKCKGCLLCISVCPRKEIVVSDKMNRRGARIVKFKDDGLCSGCGMCAIICPDCCIEVYK